MGMFDTVHWKCPHCKAEHSEQSKSGECDLTDYKASYVPKAIAEDFSNCAYLCQCGKAFRFERRNLRGFAAELKPVAASVEEFEWAYPKYVALPAYPGWYWLRSEDNHKAIIDSKYKSDHARAQLTEERNEALRLVAAFVAAETADPNDAEA